MFCLDWDEGGPAARCNDTDRRLEMYERVEEEEEEFTVICSAYVLGWKA